MTRLWGIGALMVNVLMQGIIFTAVKGNESDCNGGTCKKFSLTAEEVFDIQNNPDIIKFITEALQRQLAANPNMDNMNINTNIIPVLSDSKPTMSYATLGCFQDYRTRAIPEVEKKYSALMDNYHQRVNAIEKCAKVAAAGGYRVFAVQDGGWCATGPSAHETYSKYGPSQKCKSDGKGGSWANQVYALNGWEPDA